jgi:FeS assembly protein SufD
MNNNFQIQEPKWLEKMRSDATNKLQAFALPKERDEAWRYTDLKALGVNLSATTESEIKMDGEADGIIFTDLLDAINRYPELIRGHIGKLIECDDKIKAFHFSNLINGVFVSVPDNAHAKLSSKIAGGAHTIIITGKNSTLEYEEEHTGDGLSTDAVEIFSGENSIIDFSSVQNCSQNARKFSIKSAKLEKNSRLRWNFGSIGSAFHRTDAKILFSGEGSEAETLCAFRSKEEQHFDFNVICSHEVPHTSSNVTAKGTLSGRSSSVFRGIIKIGKNAQQTNSFLEDHALLLSDEAIANNIPSLEIDTNDVKAKHGATIGHMDEEKLFYIMSRGLSRESAERIMENGFMESLISKIKNPRMQENFKKAFA